jgi:hypothetical protein
METCQHAIAPTWHHDDSGIIVWTDRLCVQCARRFTLHFWMMYLNQRNN